MLELSESRRLAGCWSFRRRPCPTLCMRFESEAHLARTSATRWSPKLRSSGSHGWGSPSGTREIEETPQRFSAEPVTARADTERVWERMELFFESVSGKI